MLDKLKKLQYGLKVKWYEKSREHTRVIDLGGRKVQVMEGGEGAPLLYLHSAYGENLWLPFHQRLSEKFRVIAPAHPGFAESEGIEDIDTMEDMIFHYLDFFDHIVSGPIDIVGVSLGGWIAAEFATRYPDRVKRLVLATPAGLWMNDHPMTDMFALMRRPEKLRAVLFHDPTSYLADLLLPTEPAEDQLAEALKAAGATAKLAWNPPGHNPKLAGRLKRIKAQTMILWGDDDRLIPTPYAEEWAKYIKDSHIVYLKDCGHLVMFEGEDDFVSAVTQFLS
ncbi:MAG TPA: alpha/beta hydrolase [Blastocatellia bacterium]